MINKQVARRQGTWNRRKWEDGTEHESVNYKARVKNLERPASSRHQNKDDDAVTTATVWDLQNRFASPLHGPRSAHQLTRPTNPWAFLLINSPLKRSSSLRVNRIIKMCRVDNEEEEETVYSLTTGGPQTQRPESSEVGIQATNIKVHKLWRNYVKFRAFLAQNWGEVSFK